MTSTNQNHDDGRVTIYTWHVEKAYSAWDEGIKLRLQDYDDDNPYYEVWTDGGVDYILPDGYEVAQSQSDGIDRLYAVDDNFPVELKLVDDRPAIVTGVGEHLFLELA